MINQEILVSLSLTVMMLLLPLLTSATESLVIDANNLVDIFLGALRYFYNETPTVIELPDSEGSFIIAGKSITGTYKVSNGVLYGMGTVRRHGDVTIVKHDPKTALVTGNIMAGPIILRYKTDLHCRGVGTWAKVNVSVAVPFVEFSVEMSLLANPVSLKIIHLNLEELRDARVYVDTGSVMANFLINNSANSVLFVSLKRIKQIINEVLHSAVEGMEAKIPIDFPS